MASPSPSDIYGPRTGRSRDIRGHGPRGPFSLPGPLSPNGLRLSRTRRQRFAETVTEAFEALRPVIEATGHRLAIAVEDAPLLPEDWPDDVPASTLRRRGLQRIIVIYRFPITQRAFSAEETEALVCEIVARRVADAIGVDPDDLLAD